MIRKRLYKNNDNVCCCFFFYIFEYCSSDLNWDINNSILDLINAMLPILPYAIVNFDFLCMFIYAWSLVLTTQTLWSINLWSTTFILTFLYDTSYVSLTTPKNLVICKVDSPFILLCLHIRCVLDDTTNHTQTIRYWFIITTNMLSKID